MPVVITKLYPAVLPNECLLPACHRHKHVEVLEKYALAEFDLGSSDRARVVFEDLLSNYPKRMDLWHVYVDKETKLGNVLQARQIYDRMVSSKMSMKNMKTIFKKYLAFELAHGSIDQQEAVKSKAREYVSSIM
jgi:rRNA biogenesis protein RRP5